MSSPDQAAPAAPVRADLPAPTKMLKGRTVYRVVWKLNTDVLVGYCWCGTTHEDTDPIALWEWLLAHPDTHGGGRTDSAVPDPEPELVDA
ncbi:MULTISPECIES: hypothetical protein [unclassified Streptomyces]|uniref:hypothetical protein n=1 Tax=unclassified Streptomyces TaxID=2593676 RepID=UPI002DDC5B05|nr:hypothetical protein [Streptomyces sp. NBC_01474]